MSFDEKIIDVQFRKGQGTFYGSGLNVLKISGLSVRAKIIRAGGNSFGRLTANIYGLSLSQMNQISTLGAKIQFTPKDEISLFTGTREKGAKLLAFQGNITGAFAQFDSMPNVDMTIEAQTEYGNTTAKADQLSYDGSVEVAVVCERLAQQMNLKFENNGVTAIQSNPHLFGSAINQLQSICQASDTAYDIYNGVLAIWPKLGSRRSTGSQIPLISPKTGLKGYPTYTSWGLMVRSQYRPDIEFAKKVKVESDLKAATGSNWVVYTIDHEIACGIPNGLWDSVFGLYDPAFGGKVAGR